MSSAIWRTVLGPRDHSTRRIASSASVGLRRSFMRRIIYDTLRRCQYECCRREKTEGTEGNGITRRNRGTEKNIGEERLFLLCLASVASFLCVNPFPPSPPFPSLQHRSQCQAPGDVRRRPEHVGDRVD